MYYVYILFNEITNRYYIGYTPDLRKRIQRHLSGKVQSTKSNLNYKLVHYSSFVEKADALGFEKYLKSGSGVAFMYKHFLKSLKKL
ncbi:GIY-YIG nuclease family protein [Candidatus Curtissbacteria bacterium]|nr:GIY-YIG nuclease family protein [Candidatus Curtissbacteria bacterium]